MNLGNHIINGLKDQISFQLTGNGAVGELEARIANYYGMKHALCVSSATTGLLGIALAADLRSTEFITSPYTFGATVASWLMLGNSIVFADVESRLATIDPRNVENAITSRTRAILSVDILGNPSDSKELKRVADEHGLWYFADAAQSFGAWRDNLPASSYADALVISFTSGKTLFAGEGGAIVTNNSDLYDRLIWHTQHPFRQKLELGLTTCNEFGINGRINPFAALFANENYERALLELQEYQTKSHRIIEILEQEGLIEEVDFGVEKIRPSFFRISIIPSTSGASRKIQTLLANKAIECEVSGVPASVIYRDPTFALQWRKQSKLNECREAERQAEKRICLSLTDV